MDALPNLDQFNRAFAKCARMLAEEMPKMTDPAMRAQVQAIAADLEKNQAILQVEYPKVLSHIQETADKVKQSAQQSLADVQDLRAKIAAMEAEQAMPAVEVPPAPPARPEVDPALGGQWRAELLAWLTSRDAVKGQEEIRDKEGSVATFWKDTEGAEETPAAPTPPPAESPVLRPKSSRPLSRPSAEPKKPEAEPPQYDESIGKMSFDDE
jgi:hypothetical protein